MPKIKVNNPKNIIKGTPTRYYFKLHNTGGPKGDKGDTGDTGPQGPKGDTGNAATVQVGSTTTLPVGQDATVENVGNQYAAILNFGIPQGPQGPQGVKGDKGDTGDTGPQGATGAKGDPGTNATVYVGTTTTGNPGTQASVRNSGTENNAVLNFTIPQGATGAVGPANTLSIGSVTRGADASATITGDAPNQTLNLVLPKGDKGDTGATGAEGPRGPQGIQGETGEAFSIYKTYSSVADMNADASNVPEGKFTLIASNVDDPDNSKLFVKNGEGTFTYLTDMSGAQGIQGPAGPQGVRGDTGPVGPQGETGPRGSVKSQYVAELPASGDEDTFYITDKDLESHTESGEYINFETTQTAAAIQSAQIDGNATQTTYSGKNLLENKATTRTYLGVTLTKNDDGSITLNGTSTGNAQFYLTYNGVGYHAPSLELPAGTYTLNGLDNNGVKFECNYTVEGESGAKYSIGTFTASAKITCGIYVTVQNGSSVNNLKIYPQLEAGSTATSYEPYVGGTPAPNPSYPQPISVVTGENVVKVVGKNLWSTDNAQAFVTAVNVTTQAELVTEDSKSCLRFKQNAGYGSYPTKNFTLGVQFKPNTQYTVSFDMKSTTSNRHVAIYYTDGTYTAGGYNATLDEWSSQTITSEAGKTVAYIAPFYTSGDTYIDVNTIQLELGSTATSYQAFTEEDYEVNLGKNLFDKDDAPIAHLLIGTTSLTATASGGATYIPVVGGQTYTFSRQNTTDQASDSAYCFTSELPAGEVPTIGRTVFGNNLTFTTTAPENAKYLVVYFAWAKSDATIRSIFGTFQIEKGSTATTYAPYFTPLELAKIGTYQDRIYKEGEKWYVEKQVGKVVFDGTESWPYYSTYGGFRYRNDNFNVSSNNPSEDLICSHFTVATVRGASPSAPVIKSYTLNTDSTYIFLCDGTSDVDAFKTWISNNKPTLYYGLATPTTTEITNQSLIDQLEALASAALNQGVNNIWTEIATGNAMPTLELNWVEWQKYNKHNVYIWNDDIDDWQVIVS